MNKGSIFKCETNQKDWNNDLSKEKRKEIYNSMKKEEYENLDACVKNAIKMENHVAFVHFYMEKVKNQKEIFLSVLDEYINEYDNRRKKNKSLPSWGKFKIIDTNYWRSYEFDYTQENVKKVAYEGSHLTHWKDFWHENKNIPHRDVIVQLCLYLGKNLEDTNRLLMAAGHPMLYVADIVDVVSIYYLEKYQENFDIKAFEKLKEVKDKINLGLKRSLTNDKIIISTKGKKGEWVSIGEDSFLKKKIYTLIEEYRNILEQDEENKMNKGNTDYLTILYKKKLEDLKIEQYIESGMIADETYVLTQKRYGYLKKTFQYLESYNKYKKNLKYYSHNLTIKSSEEIKGKDFNGVDTEKLEKKLDKCEKKIDELKKTIKDINIENGKYKEEHKKEIEKYENKKTNLLFKIVGNILDMSQKLDILGKENVKLDMKLICRSKVKSHVEGRSLFDEKAYQAETKEKIKIDKKTIIKDKKGYRMDLSDKVFCMKYAIATGREDELGKYLVYAGLWKEDWLAIRNIESKEDFKLLNREDFFILYALKYRDALLKKLSEGKDETEFINKTRREFPFIKLLMIINRDIQFVNKNILRPKEKIENLEKLLIYPVTL